MYFYILFNLISHYSNCIKAEIEFIEWYHFKKIVPNLIPRTKMLKNSIKIENYPKI